MRYPLIALIFFVAASAFAQASGSKANVCYTGKDELFGVRFGSTKPKVLAAMLKLGLNADSPSEITCSRSVQDRSQELCEVNVDSEAWQKIRPYPVLGDEHFALGFTDGLFTGSVQILEFVDHRDAVDGYYKAKETFAISYSRPGKNLGFWRRQNAKFGSAVMGAKFVNAATWEDRRDTSSVVLLEGHNAIVMLIHGRKGFDE